MMAVDIFQVEDNVDIQFITQTRVNYLGLSYLGVSNYEELKDNITQAKVYLVDCNIPKNEGLNPELLAQNIIDTIRSKNYSGKIVLFSNDYKSKEIAKDNDVSAIDKMDIDSLDKLLTNVKTEEQLN